MRYFFACICCISLLSCSLKEPLYHNQSYVFGTLVDISTYGETDAEGQNITATILREFQNLHNRLHAWKPSELNGINHQIAQGNSARVAPDIADMLKQSTQYSVQSGGLFNPAIGELIQTWGFQNDEFHALSIDTKKIATLVKANPQMTDLIIEDNHITSKNRHVQLDLGGYAKGYALDVGMTMLKNQGVKNALINIGGNVIALGKHGEHPWRVGIQHPRKPNAIAALNLESGWAIGTSGDYQRYFMLDGKRYCHIIDPRTGIPAQGTQSVTVLIPPQANAGVLSDVTSKPIFISEPNKKQEAIKRMNVKDVMIIQENGDILITPSMLKRIEWLEPDAKTHLQILQSLS
ncbi:MAG TPA: thiamine biosynthesis protein ApbE [Methylophilaceae bacterium]|nr:thiamine biosynthesis protein ApbE [Methylophilaceae bacterium]HAJ71590.1 thiamine biosynthesis protein ApbE [Methylophilaceae bacterium]